MYVSIASAERRIWYVSASSARICPTDQWRAKAALPQPTHHIPAEHPPRHGDRGLSFGTERLGMGRAGARGAMRELADQMQRPIEREHPMMAMVTNGQRTAACPAPLLLDCQFDACELRVFWPAIRHEGPLLVQDMVGNQHTIYRPMCVLAFYRIVDYYKSSEGWRVWSRANGEDTQPLEFVSVHRGVLSCGADSGCALEEDFGAVIPDTMLRAYQGGFSVKFSAETGQEMVIHLTSQQIQQQLKAIEDFQASRKK